MQNVVRFRCRRPSRWAHFWYNLLNMQIQFRKAEEKDTALVLAFIRELAKYEKMEDQVVARERGCGRLEWWCLDWNAPSIRFYKSLGAEAMTDWTVYRLAGEALEKMA